RHSESDGHDFPRCCHTLSARSVVRSVRESRVGQSQEALSGSAALDNEESFWLDQNVHKSVSHAKEISGRLPLRAGRIERTGGAALVSLDPSGTITRRQLQPQTKGFRTRRLA